MKFRLSTLMLSAFLTIAITGWLIERSRLQRECGELSSKIGELESQLDVKIKPLADGSLALATAMTTSKLYFEHSKTNEIPSRLLADKTVGSVVDVWRQRDNIRLFYTKRGIEFNKPIEVVLAAGVLATLGHKTKEDFFDAIIRVKQFDGNQAEYPELFDPYNDRYSQFRKFVDMSLETSNQK